VQGQRKEAVQVVEKVGVAGCHAHTEGIEQILKLDEEAVRWASLRKLPALMMQKTTREVQRMPVLKDLWNGQHGCPGWAVVELMNPLKEGVFDAPEQQNE
jgi:hypothetical protein